MPNRVALQLWNRYKWEYKNRSMYRDGRAAPRWPWYADSLDPDVAQTLHEHGILGGALLDVGTCSGSQAIALAKLGFEVTGTDVSETALGKARANLAREEAGLTVEFVLDDIVSTRLPADRFDVILDRACFHSIYHFGKERYIENVLRILKPQGMVLMKTMSAEEERFDDYDTIGNLTVQMPRHFDRQLLRDTFADSFTIHDIRDSFFYSSNLERPARAYLTILSAVEPG